MVTCRRRLLPLLALLALLAAPFGRIAAAEAMTAGHHPPMAMTGHCEDMPSPQQDKTDKTAIDCMIACAAMATEDACGTTVRAPLVAGPIAGALPVFFGLHPEADPPPPRFS